MKLLLLALFSFIVFSYTSSAQKKQSNKFCQLIIDTKGLNFDRSKSTIFIKSDPRDTIVAQKKTLAKQCSFILHPAEPFFAHIEIMVDSNIFTSSSGFIVTNDPIKIIFDSTTIDPKVSGGENEFYYKHRFLLFQLPAIIKNDPQFKVAVLKNSYDPQIADMRLRFFYGEFENNVIDIITEHKNYYYLLSSLLSQKEFFSVKTLEKCYSLFTDILKNTSKGKELKRYIEQSKRLFVGEPAPAFAVLNEKDVKENSFSIYSTSKITLIDFWASWCVPCRESMREIKKIYTDIDTAKFQIVSISIDRYKNSWLKAVKEENIPWRSYYDPGGSDGTIGKLFNLDYIPQNRIIDTNGKMIAFDLSPEELLQFLKERGLLIKKGF